MLILITIGHILSPIQIYVNEGTTVKEVVRSHKALFPPGVEFRLDGRSIQLHEQLDVTLVTNQTLVWSGVPLTGEALPVEVGVSFEQSTEIEMAMIEALRKCGSHPPPRYCRIAFAAAMKTLGVEVRYHV